MKYLQRSLLGAAVLSITLSATADSSQQFNRIDANKNGSVDAAEFHAFWELAFRNFDKNGDGVHSKDEHRHDASFAAFDKDKNGVVDADEARAIRAMHFEQLDKDGDDLLSLDEFSSAGKGKP